METLVYRTVVHGETEVYAMLYYLVEHDGRYYVRICSVRGDGAQRSALSSMAFEDYLTCLRCIHKLYKRGVGPMGMDEAVMEIWE